MKSIVAILLFVTATSGIAARPPQPGSVDESFAPNISVPGFSAPPVRSIAVSPLGSIMVVAELVVDEFVSIGFWNLVTSDGNTILQGGGDPWDDALAAGFLTNETFRIGGQGDYWTGLKLLKTEDVNATGQITRRSEDYRVIYSQDRPITAAVIFNGRLAVASRFLGSEVVYVEPNHMWNLFASSGNQGIPVDGPPTPQRVRAFAAQPDGSTIVGGQFTGVANFSRTNLSRLLPNGDLDPTFGGAATENGADREVSVIASLPDGRLILGGTFQTVFGVPRNRIARLLPDGTADPSFNVGTGPNDRVQAIAALNDGRVVIAGSFNSVNGITRNRVARLNSDGTVDSTFDVGTGPDTPPTQVAVEPNGDVLIGGDFTSVNGISVTSLARLHGDGPRCSAPVLSTSADLNFDVLARPRARCVIEASTNLLNWKPILTNVPPTTPWTVTYSLSNSPRTFFRAVQD